MFTTLMNWIAGPFWTSVKTVWKIIYDSFNGALIWIIATVTGFLVITERVTGMVLDAVTHIAAAAGILAGALNSQSGHASVMVILNQANCFYPVEEGLTLMSSLILVTLASMAYRLIKSWIPTVS